MMALLSGRSDPSTWHGDAVGRDADLSRFPLGVAVTTRISVGSVRDLPSPGPYALPEPREEVADADAAASFKSPHGSASPD
jgi:hypothetical protein